MADSKNQAADILRTALKGEEDGHRFYDLLSKKATNADARRKLEGLRDDEVRHTATLRAIFEKYIGGEVGPLPEEGLTALAEVFRKGQLEERTSEMQFIDLAIEAELAATKYYREQRELIDEPDFKAVFDQLAAEEHSHYELLMAEREALTGNYYWFDIDGSSPVEH